MSQRIFISYRRADSQWATDAVYKALSARLPSNSVFMDVDSAGCRLVEYLDDAVKWCDLVLVMIGPHWLDIVDPATGRRRLDNENDFVRIEVRQALARKIPVVPVLLDGTPMPAPDQLPEELRPLVRRNAAFIQMRTPEADLATLLRQLLWPAISPAVCQGLPSIPSCNCMVLRIGAGSGVLSH